jgi:hypothetical protein
MSKNTVRNAINFDIIIIMLRKPLICLLNWTFEKLSLVIPLRSPTASVHFLCDLSRAQLADFRNMCSLGPCPHGSRHGHIDSERHGGAAAVSKTLTAVHSSGQKGIECDFG